MADESVNSLTEAQRDTLVHAATQAPSSHNTQPWRFVTTAESIELHADRTRALPVNDPDGREVVISCGAALTNLETASAHLGMTATVDVLPDPRDVDHLATIRFSPAAEIEHDLFDSVARRRTTRKPFGDGALTDVEVKSLLTAARSAQVEPLIVDLDHREEFAELIADADRAQFEDPDWRRELAGWMRAPSEGDGLATPSILGALVRGIVTHLDIGRSAADTDGQLVTDAPLVMILSTATDQTTDWLATGRALEQMLLVAAEHDLAAGHFNQVCQVADVRELVQSSFTPRRHPQMVVRLGHPVTGDPRSARRPIDDVMTERTT